VGHQGTSKHEKDRVRTKAEGKDYNYLKPVQAKQIIGGGRLDGCMDGEGSQNGE